jgi:hypothetical protein
MMRVACHGPAVTFVIKSNSCCATMWHTINNMMKTLNLNPSPNSCYAAMWHTINSMKTLNLNPNLNNCCVAMWHTTNSMMKTLNLNPNFNQLLCYHVAHYKQYDENPKP